MGNNQTEKAFEEKRLAQILYLSNIFQMYCPNWEKIMLFLPCLKIYLVSY